MLCDNDLFVCWIGFLGVYIQCEEVSSNIFQKIYELKSWWFLFFKLSIFMITHVQGIESAMKNWK